MVKRAEEPVEALVESIIARSKPRQDRKILRKFLTNVVIFMKLARGVELSKEEQNYNAAPFFAHFLMGRGSESADALQRRLEIIDHYEITDIDRIIYIITSTTLDPYRPSMSERKTQLLMELHRNPLQTQQTLAEQLQTSPQVIRKELAELQRDFALRTLTVIDPHKFRLAQRLVFFRTNSLDSSEELERSYRTRRPIFLRRMLFDHDYRQGCLIYFVPDQPRGHQLFEERIQSIRDQYLDKSYIFNIEGQYVHLSLDNYDSRSGSWIFEINSVTEAILHSLTHSKDPTSTPLGIKYSKPIHFDKADFLLAETSFIDSGPKRADFRYKVLKRFGFDLSKKTIWARERKLWQAGVFFPVTYFTIPKFEEHVMLIVHCSEKAQEQIQRLALILPFAFINPLKRGILILFQRPTKCVSISSQLIKAISQIQGIRRLHLLRLPSTIGASITLEPADRWDVSRQRWLPQMTDF